MKISMIALAAALMCATPALADDAGDAGNDKPANTILVVGQRDHPIEIEQRGLAVSLGDEQFKAINAFNTEDLMKYAPDFFVRKRYSGDSNGVPGFRGTHSTQSARTLIMVDGFVVSNFLGNSFTYSPKWGVVGPTEVKQFDIVYGPYSSRYVGNSMGGIVNITTREPERTEAIATVQGTVEPFDQFSTHKSYWGGSAEAGVGFKQKDGPWSLRVTGRYFHNTGQPMMFYGLVPVAGTSGTVVTGAVIDPKQLEATAAGTGLERVPPGQPTPAVPGSVANPIFAAQSPATITQDQAKLKVGYDDGTFTGELLFAFWHNEDKQFAPDCYLRDAGGNIVCDGTVRIGTQSYTAAGANWSETLRDEYLLGLKLGADLGDGWDAKLAISTYQIVRQDGFTSAGYEAGKYLGTGTLAAAGPTNWYTGDFTVERKGGINDVAMGLSASFYRTDMVNWTLPNWTSKANEAFSSETFGKTRILSAWAEDVLHLSPAAQITAGLRFDDWLAYGGGLGRLGTGALAGQRVYNTYTSRNETAVNPTLSAQINLKGTLVELSLAMATRFPTVGELYQGSLNGDGTFNINSFDPNLKPERSKDANLLVSRKLGSVQLTGSLFYQRVENTIFQFFGFNQNGVSSSTFKNIDVTRQWGIEAIAETKDWPIQGMAIEGNVAYIDSKTIRNVSNPLAEGVQFPRIPRWRINANLRYDLTKQLQASLGMRYASRPNTDLFGLQRGDTFGFTSELFALDARLNCNVNDRFRISAGVDNITDDRAWVFHPYPQRTFLLEAGWRL
jgi:iron complex outermembrane receptor protein